jgi:hypothetical protein
MALSLVAFAVDLRAQAGGVVPGLAWAPARLALLLFWQPCWWLSLPGTLPMLACWFLAGSRLKGAGLSLVEQRYLSFLNGWMVEGMLSRWVECGMAARRISSRGQVRVQPRAPRPTLRPWPRPCSRRGMPRLDS